MEKKKNKEKRNPVFLIILLMLFIFSSKLLKERMTEQKELDYGYIEKAEILNEIDWEYGFKETSNRVKRDRLGFVNKLTLELNEEQNEVFVAVALEYQPSNEDLTEYLEKIIYYIGDYSRKNNQLREPSRQPMDYGEIFDAYNIVVGASSKHNLDNPDNWLVHYRIPKGSHKKIKMR